MYMYIYDVTIYIYIYIYCEFFSSSRLDHKRFYVFEKCNMAILGFNKKYGSNNQTGDISSVDGTPLKLVDKFTYLGSSVSSTEKDIDTRLTKT